MPLVNQICSTSLKLGTDSHLTHFKQFSHNTPWWHICFCCLLNNFIVGAVCWHNHSVVIFFLPRLCKLLSHFVFIISVCVCVCLFIVCAKYMHSCIWKLSSCNSSLLGLALKITGLHYWQDQPSLVTVLILGKRVKYIHWGLYELCNTMQC